MTLAAVISQADHPSMARFMIRVFGITSALLLVATSCNHSDEGDTPGDGYGDGDGDGDDDGTGGESSSSGGQGGAEPGPERLSIATDLGQPAGIAVDESHVYWADQTEGRVVRCPLAGCEDEEPEVVVEGLEIPDGIDVSGGQLYIGHITDESTGEILGCDLEDCEATLTVLGVLGGLGHPFVEVNEHEGLLYFGAWPLFGSCEATGCLDEGRVDFESGPVVSIATDEDFIYTARYGWGQVHRCTLPGCEGSVDLLTAPAPLGLAVSEETLYFGQNDFYGSFFNLGGAGGESHSRILSCPKDACDLEDATVIEEGEISPYSFALTDDYLYFTNFSHGSVLAVRR